MIHGNRQARAATQSRLVIVLGAALALFVAAMLAAGVATVEFEMPWKTVATFALVAVALAYTKLRSR